jgi:hypothetical protein
MKSNKGDSMKGETKDQRFKRVAEKRVRVILDAIRKLSQCSNRRMYNWTENDLQKIWRALDREIELCKKSYTNAEPEEFKLT